MQVTRAWLNSVEHAIGPRRVGGTYHSGRFEKDYKVLAIEASASGAVKITGRWPDGSITTNVPAWDTARDRVVSQPD